MVVLKFRIPFASVFHSNLLVSRATPFAQFFCSKGGARETTPPPAFYKEMGTPNTISKEHIPVSRSLLQSRISVQVSSNDCLVKIYAVSGVY